MYQLLIVIFQLLIVIFQLLIAIFQLLIVISQLLIAIYKFLIAIFQLCFSLLYDHRCAAACHHEHRSALSYCFVVEVDAYDGVAAEALGTLRHFAHG